ncbi:hypothetical protein ES705_43883 [subsurface metagenome]
MKKSPLHTALDSLSEPRAVARRGDPETSWQAAESVAGIRESQARVYVLLHRFGPCSDERLIRFAESRGVMMSRSGIRTRRSELVDLGLVEDSDYKIKLKSGRKAIVWKAVPFKVWEDAMRRQKEMIFDPTA